MASAQLDLGGPSRRSASSSSRLDPLPSSHPLSIKIRSIFDTSNTFSSDAEATKRALQELEERYGIRKTNASKTKPGKIISVDTERARRCLAEDAEDAHEEACCSFLQALGNVDAAVGLLGEHVGQLRSDCRQLDVRLSEADDSTRYLLQHADGIRKQRAMTAQQADLLSLFMQRFTLTEDEEQAIESRAIQVGPSLFAVMDKLQRIRNESQILLVGQEEGVQGGMRAGMDIMNETSTLLDKAQQKIAKWLYSEMRSFTREGVDVGQYVREAVMRLDGREDLLAPALKALASARAHLLSTAFQRALTVGGPAPSFLPRPIELHAHDPLRYVGDMLAWVHQSVASEREFLTALFSKLGDQQNVEGMRRVGQRRRGLEGSIDWTGNETAGLPKSELWTRQTLDKVLEGCCQPLQIRIEQTVNSQEGCITTFRLASLIQFYRVTMERTLGTQAVLSRTLKAISVSAYRAFLGTIDRMAGGLGRFNESPEEELAPPAPVLGATATLKELLEVHQASLSEADLFGDALPLRDLPSEEMRDFAMVIVRLIEPILALCTRMGDRLVSSKGRSETDEQAGWKRDIFLVNCLTYIKGALELHHFAARSIGRVEEDLKQHTEELIKRHYVQLAAESGLDRASNAITEAGLGSGDIDVELVNKALAAFERFLQSPTLISSPHLSLLNAPTTRASVHSHALELVARDYDKIVAHLQEQQQGAAELRNAAQIRLLLGIEARGAE